MSRASLKSFFEVFGSTTALRADQPMDAGYCWTVLDNVAHMVDESSQYRINWLQHRDPTNGGSGDDGGDIGLPVAEFFFPTQLLYRDRYPRYDVRIATRSTDVTTVRASIVLTSVPPPIIGLTTGVIVTATADTTDTDPDHEWVIDQRLESGSQSRAPYPYQVAPSAVDGLAMGQIVIVKLIVEADPDLVELVGVQVREFTE